MFSHRAQDPLRRVLIMHQGALGDFLLTLPALEGFSLCHPEARFDFWSKKEHVALIALRGYAGSFHSAESSELSPFYHDDLWRLAPLPKPFEEADATFVIGQGVNRVFAERMKERLGRAVFWIQSFPLDEDAVPVSRFILDQFVRLGFPLVETAPRLDPPRDEKLAVKAWLSARGMESCAPVVIHPGSGGRKKIWPLAKWRALLDYLLRERGCRVIMTLGPADECLKEFAREAALLGVEAVDGLSLPRLAALLGGSRLYVGSDSGVSHLAAAAGAPSLVVFGPTSPEVWAPRGPNVKIFQDSWNESEVFQSPLSSMSRALDSAVESALEDLLEAR